SVKAGSRDFPAAGEAQLFSVTTVTPSPPSKPSPLRKVSTCGDPERYSLTPRISEPVPFPWIIRTSLVPISVQLSRNLSNAPIASSTLNPIRLSSFSASVTLCAPELLQALLPGLSTAGAETAEKG